MTTYEKWSNYVYATIAGVASVTNFIVGEWLIGALFLTIAFFYVIEHEQKRQLADLREDLELALKREREYLYRAVKAEHDANVAKLREMAPMTIVAKRGDAE